MRRLGLAPLLLVLLASILVLAACTHEQEENEAAPPPPPAESPPPSPPPVDTGNGSAFDRIPQIIEEVQPSVVAVNVGEGAGSGVIYDGEGRIITNHHVATAGGEIEVVFATGERTQARLLASDERTDVAVLEVDTDELRPAQFADELPQIGTLAVAMGNPLGFEHSVTAGIVSGLNRAIPAGGQAPALVDLIQTDAPISPGNSGGALVGADGRVIGINVAYIPPQARAVAIGFAIPAPTVVSVADQLIENGQVEHAFLGVQLAQVTASVGRAFNLGVEHGALVQEVVGGSPAGNAGMQVRDVIVEFGDEEVRTVEDVLAGLRERSPGDTVTIVVIRDRERQELEATLTERND
jgi:S1-C subfamily serine protease